MTAAPLDEPSHWNATDSLLPALATPPGRPVDPAINRDAGRAQAGDRSIRNSLYALFRPEMAKFVRRYAHWAGGSGAWDLDDVWQESFFAFDEVVMAWPGVGDFVGYFYAVFPKRLASKVRRLDGRQPRLATGSSVEPSHDPRQTIEGRTVLTGYIASLPLLDRQILALHLWEELPLADIAAHLGMSLNELSKRWRGIRRSAQKHRQLRM